LQTVASPQVRGRRVPAHERHRAGRGRPPRPAVDAPATTFFDYADEDQSAAYVRPGMRVRHPAFGIGTVASVEPLAGDVKLTVRFEAAVYVLHAFQKKARRGIATPKQEFDLVRRRLAVAERHYRDTHRGD